jgi:hypothetical protein
MSDIKTFRFQRYNYGVIALEDESGIGKSLFAKDLAFTDEIPAPYEVYLLSVYNNRKSDIETKLKSSKQWFKNKIIVIDDTEMMDKMLLSTAINKTIDINTQWVLIGHGGFVGLRYVSAFRKLDIKQQGDEFYIKLVMDDVAK